MSSPSTNRSNPLGIPVALSNVSRPSSKRPPFLQRRHLLDLQLATRLAFLEARVDAFAQRALGLSPDVTATPFAAWPVPDFQEPLILQESIELFRVAGELQRIRSLCSMQRIQATAAIAASELREQDCTISATSSTTRHVASNSAKDEVEVPSLFTSEPMATLASVVRTEQLGLTRLPLLSFGAVGFWGELTIDPESAESVYRHASRLHRTATASSRREWEGAKCSPETKRRRLMTEAVGVSPKHASSNEQVPDQVHRESNRTSTTDRSTPPAFPTLIPRLSDDPSSTSSLPPRGDVQEASTTPSNDVLLHHPSQHSSLSQRLVTSSVHPHPP